MGITLTMKLLIHESKFFKNIDTLCDPKNLIVLLFTIFSLKITSFSIFNLQNFSNK
jgi:hypothetical protein